MFGCTIMCNPVCCVGETLTEGSEVYCCKPTICRARYCVFCCACIVCRLNTRHVMRSTA